MSRRNGFRTFLSVGLPMVGLLGGGVYFLSTFVQTNIDIRDIKHGKTKTHRQLSLEEEYNNIMKNLDIDNFSLSRIPKPDEEQAPKVSVKKNESD